MMIAPATVNPTQVPPEAFSEENLFQRYRDELRDENGQTYAELKRSLNPRYSAVWIQLALAYLSITCLVAGLVVLQPWLTSWWSSALAGWTTGLLIGYVIAFLSLWFHEATHYNIHRNRIWNDRLANFCLGVLLIQDVRKNRRVHFAHHKYLGSTEDTERSYFAPLNLRFLLESVTGIKVLRVLLLRAQPGGTGHQQTPVAESYLNWVSFTGLTLHLAVIACSLYLNQYALATAWAFGVFIFFPSFCALRQVLEHRSPDADPACDYSKTAHGEYTRAFNESWFANTFGGAGFNRHLIHHWDPRISCTNFAKVERFVEASQLSDFYRDRKTSYREALLLLSRQTSSQKR